MQAFALGSSPVSDSGGVGGGRASVVDPAALMMQAALAAQTSVAGGGSARAATSSKYMATVLGQHRHQQAGGQPHPGGGTLPGGGGVDNNALQSMLMRSIPAQHGGMAVALNIQKQQQQMLVMGSEAAGSMLGVTNNMNMANILMGGRGNSAMKGPQNPPFSIA